jgi:hypothetical protein
MKLAKTEIRQVALVEWFPEQDGLSQVICRELTELGYEPVYFKFDEPIPPEADVVFTYGPYGKLMPILYRANHNFPEKRPVTVHWNMEGLPDLRLPWLLMRRIGAIRSWIGRLNISHNHPMRNLLTKLTTPWENRVLRFRYVGDYHFAYKKGLLNVLADSSAIYAKIHSQHGLPTVVAPWGSTPLWYENLTMDRDIDILWLGQRGSKRRGALLDQIRQDLLPHGVKMHVADNQENPFIYGRERTEYLNRTKITLNLIRTWYDDNYSRFAMAAPNRSLIVSEDLLPHCPQYIPGTHYVSAPTGQLAQKILYFLNHSSEREAIVENAYQISTSTITFRRSVEIIMTAVEQARQKMSSHAHTFSKSGITLSS